MKKERFKPGDIFRVGLDNDEYAFGRCLTKISYGHTVEIFKYFSKEPVFDLSITEERLLEPFPIDSFSFFFKREKKGDWKVLSEQADFIPHNVNHLRFYGMDGSTINKTTLLNISDKQVGEIDKSEIEKAIHPVGRHFIIPGYDGLVFLLYSPWNDFVVKKEIEKYRASEHI